MRRRSRELPEFLKIGIVPEPSGTASGGLGQGDPAARHNHCLQIELDGGGAVVSSPPCPISSQFSLALTLRLKTAGLMHDGAWVELALLDAEGNVLQTHASPPLTNCPDWQTVHLGPIAAVNSKVTQAVVSLHVQPLGKREDLTGRAWFDDLRIDAPAADAARGLQARRACMPSATPPSWSARFRAFACAIRECGSSCSINTDKLLAESSTALLSPQDAAKLGREGPAGRWLRRPGHLGAAAARSTLASIASGPRCWPKIRPRRCSTARRRWPCCGRWRRPRAASSAGRCRRRRTACLWPAGDAAGPVGPGLGQDAGLVRPARNGQGRPHRLVCRAAQHPRHRAGRGARSAAARAAAVFREQGRLPVATVFAEPELWQPAVGPIMTRLSLKVHWWQLGDDSDVSFVGYPQLEAKLRRNQAEPGAIRPADSSGNQLAVGLCRAEGQRPARRALGVSVVWHRSAADRGGNWRPTWPSPAAQRAAAAAAAADVASEGEQSASPRWLRAARQRSRRSCLPARRASTGPRRWVLVAPLARGEYSNDVRVQDLVQRMLAAKMNGANAVFVPQPFTTSRGS